jgi:dipeptidyl aminopeptidase/acylaminoacyl peptidase
VLGRKYLEGLDWVDGSRVGIMGGSYGGFMVAAALTLEPEAFDVGVDIYGVTNWVRTLKSIPAWWASFRDSLYAEMGDPATDEARFEAHLAALQRRSHQASSVRRPGRRTIRAC